jgi:hypothetical protein
MLKNRLTKRGLRGAILGGVGDGLAGFGLQTVWGTAIEFVTIPDLL